MKAPQLVCSAAVLLFCVGCDQTPAPREPAGVVYQGKRVSEWGDQLKNPDQQSRLEAAKLLHKMGKEGLGTKEAIPELEAAVTDASAEVRGWAVVALVYAVRGTPYPITQKTEPMAALKEAAESPNEELRAVAREIKDRMDQPGRGPGPNGGAPAAKAQGEGG